MLGSSPEVILSLDEIQKVPDWSSTVKFLWDEDTRRGNNIKVVATGSSALTLRGGMAESLKGRFEEIASTQWTLAECRDAFGYSLDDFLFFGGYPGAAALKDEPDRWFAYMHDSIIEPTITQDVLEMETVKSRRCCERSSKSVRCTPPGKFPIESCWASLTIAEIPRSYHITLTFSPMRGFFPACGSTMRNR